MKGELIFEGEYIDGKKNGKGKEYYYHDKLKFEGEYINGERNVKGKEYFNNGHLKFEGEYLNGEKNGKVKKYFWTNYYYSKNECQLIFEGEYLNNYIIKGKEYYKSGKLKFEGDYIFNN